jgi:hypothetical protein
VPDRESVSPLGPIVLLTAWQILQRSLVVGRRYLRRLSLHIPRRRVRFLHALLPLMGMKQIVCGCGARYAI